MSLARAPIWSVWLVGPALAMLSACAPSRSNSASALRCNLGPGPREEVYRDPVLVKNTGPVAESLLAWADAGNAERYEQLRSRLVAALSLTPDQWRRLGPRAYFMAAVTAPPRDQWPLSVLLSVELKRGWSDPIGFYGSAFPSEPFPFRYVVLRAIDLQLDTARTVELARHFACGELSQLVPVFDSGPVRDVLVLSVETHLLIESLRILKHGGPQGEAAIRELDAAVSGSLRTFLHRVLEALRREAS